MKCDRKEKQLTKEEMNFAENNFLSDSQKEMFVSRGIFKFRNTDQLYYYVDRYDKSDILYEEKDTLCSRILAEPNAKELEQKIYIPGKKDEGLIVRSFKQFICTISVEGLEFYYFDHYECIDHLNSLIEKDRVNKKAD